MKPYTKTISHASVISGTVVRSIRGVCTVHAEGRILTCQLNSSKGREDRGKKSKNPSFDSIDRLIVGDEVLLSVEGDGRGRIVEILPRRNSLSRREAVPMPGARPAEQLIAANIDQVVPVFAAADPPPKWNLLDRYLAAAEAAGIPALICLTKLDLAEQASPQGVELGQVLDEYRAIGYPMILTSVRTGEGIDELRAAISGRTSLLLGKSGVGKSSLLNAVEPELGQRVSAISQATGKGRHTTTAAELFPLAAGGGVVDTPGVREFGLWGLDADDLIDTFPEMRPHIGRCRFGLGCSHNEEPGCAVRQAVVDGQISPRRYASYLKLKEEL